MKFFIISVVILGILFALVPHVIYLLAKVVGLIAHFKVSYKYFGFTALGLFVLISVLMTYGYAFGRFRSEVTTFDFESESVPGAFDGYKIVQISDLHLDGWKGNSEHLKKRIDEINAINPDLVCFTGDLVSLSPSEIDGFKPILKELKAKDGVISILGNHDYLPYARHLSDSARWQQVNKVIDAERNDLGWNLLLNENTIIRHGADSIAILGCENQSVGAHPVIQRGDLAKTCEGTEGIFRILLTHDPSQWRKEVVGKTDIPLTLSGHTHAMQFRVLGFTPSKWIYPDCDGLYIVGNQKLYVNIGLGGTMPMRIGATPEITLITLRKVK